MFRVQVRRRAAARQMCAIIILVRGGEPSLRRRMTTAAEDKSALPSSGKNFFGKTSQRLNLIKSRLMFTLKTFCSFGVVLRLRRKAI